MMEKGMEISRQQVVEMLENFLDYVLPLMETQPASTVESLSREMCYHLASGQFSPGETFSPKEMHYHLASGPLVEA
jgi:hypothetical protein